MKHLNETIENDWVNRILFNRKTHLPKLIISGRPNFSENKVLTFGIYFIHNSMSIFRISALSWVLSITQLHDSLSYYHLQIIVE